MKNIHSLLGVSFFSLLKFRLAILEEVVVLQSFTKTLAFTVTLLDEVLQRIGLVCICQRWVFISSQRCAVNSLWDDIMVEALATLPLRSWKLTMGFSPPAGLCFSILA